MARKQSRKKRIVRQLLPRKMAARVCFLGLKRWIQYTLVQRIFRINSHVPWPVHWSSVVTFPDKIARAAELPFLGHHPGCYIQAMNGIRVGKNVRYGPNVHIISANHDLCDYDQHSGGSPIVIGDNCWIGSGSIILSGVELEEHVVVAAGSIVTKSFPANVLIGGTPAKVIKELTPYTGDPNWGEGK